MTGQGAAKRLSFSPSWFPQTFHLLTELQVCEQMREATFQLERLPWTRCLTSQLQGKLTSKLSFFFLSFLTKILPALT